MNRGMKKTSACWQAAPGGLNAEKRRSRSYRDYCFTHAYYPPTLPEITTPTESTTMRRKSCDNPHSTSCTTKQKKTKHTNTHTQTHTHTAAGQSACHRTTAPQHTAAATHVLYWNNKRLSIFGKYASHQLVLHYNHTKKSLPISLSPRLSMALPVSQMRVGRPAHPGLRSSSPRVWWKRPTTIPLRNPGVMRRRRSATGHGPKRPWSALPR